MVKIKVETKKGKNFVFPLEKKENFLLALDKFLKKYKILKKEIKDWRFSVSKSTDFLDYQINTAIVKALNFSISKE
ncbi:MAG: hypothetical protein AB7D02_01535 [Candidatus Paceibacterota bacterium]